MLKSFFGHLRARRVSPSSRVETILSPQTASVEEIWNSWRYSAPPPAPRAPSETAQKPDTPPKRESRPPPKSANAAGRVNQLKRLGEYEMALRVVLGEIEREEESGSFVLERQIVPWYYWEAASIYRKLKRYDDEVALVRRFARNYDINFRAFSKRHRASSGAHDAWAARFLERLDTAKAAAAEQQAGAARQG
ncbi:hypothetical protein [Bradyrhizobium sp. NP1]|uniref:hypothetical protein n=1 Tax=Bradyrhizobium sp. NP1 TaxID=3049772 RepID=UPI0025A5952C|nr:hypothetical protein [Bradyrhizobium sp. NP1]WJR81427.1 hypothetical protein QOU61_17250 [Bradyrhizobium sp. NP1]